MAYINSEIVKGYGLSAGAGVVGIAASKDFDLAPAGFSPSDHLDGCLSVIVLGVPFPREALTDGTAEYIDVRNAVNEKANLAAKDMAKKIKSHGYKVKVIGGLGGKWIDGKSYGQISMKHAAELAGLGHINRNYLFTNSQYGNLLWFSAVLTDADLVPDKTAEYKTCDNCGKCVESCPSGALNDRTSFERDKCAGTSFKQVNKKWVIRCFTCRTVCPYCYGIPK